MAYQLNTCCSNVSVILLTKTGNIEKAKKNKTKESEVKMGVILYPRTGGRPAFVSTGEILSDKEKEEVKMLQEILLKQKFNVGFPFHFCCGSICNSGDHEEIRRKLTTSTTRTVTILEESCYTIHKVEYRNYSYTQHVYNAFLELQKMER